MIKIKGKILSKIKDISKTLEVVDGYEVTIIMEEDKGAFSAIDLASDKAREVRRLERWYDRQRRKK